MLFLGHFRATIKGKIFQLRFLEEINPDEGKAERSATTGHLVVKLPRIHYRKRNPETAINKKVEDNPIKEEKTKLLEVTPSKMDFSQIVDNELDMPPLEYISD